MEFVPARNPKDFLYKNKLQEYAQKSLIPLPIYQTINEGKQHAPKFRSFVMIDGVGFVSSSTFSSRKEAEQDAARIALEGILQKTKQEGMHLIHQDKIFCKSILNEYAMKATVDKPVYTTAQSGSVIPVFVSTLVFGGKSYIGAHGKTKKEAEQSAARVAIESILSSSDTKALMSQIIKSKSRFYAAVHGTDALAVNLNTNAGLVGSAEDQPGPWIQLGIGFHTAIENDKPLTGHNSEVFSSCEHVNAEVPRLVPSVLEKPMDEVLSQGNSELIQSDPYVPAFVQVPDGPQVMISSHIKKRSFETRNDHGQEKKAKSDEDFIRLSSASPEENPNAISETQIEDT
ncbi:Double-stranded RNA-binding domain-containing protein [Dioscorea alata]|uniref:Double-stranded RNA-binding domain-containing protein n=2 Tax=Dioscorea alata TaxID=55571 RepID=A0ACB7W4V9_DIOAL|nr:Double-stranded RNA-binding domain-containing protein [Dioscorea alata]